MPRSPKVVYFTRCLLWKACHESMVEQATTIVAGEMWPRPVRTRLKLPPLLQGGQCGIINASADITPPSFPRLRTPQLRAKSLRLCFKSLSHQSHFFFSRVSMRLAVQFGSIAVDVILIVRQPSSYLAWRGDSKVLERVPHGCLISLVPLAPWPRSPHGPWGLQMSLPETYIFRNSVCLLKLTASLFMHVAHASCFMPRASCSILRGHVTHG